MGINLHHALLLALHSIYAINNLVRTSQWSFWKWCIVLRAVNMESSNQCLVVPKVHTRHLWMWRRRWQLTVVPKKKENYTKSSHMYRWRHKQFKTYLTKWFRLDLFGWFWVIKSDNLFEFVGTVVIKAISHTNLVQTKCATFAWTTSFVHKKWWLLQEQQ